MSGVVLVQGGRYFLWDAERAWRPCVHVPYPRAEIKRLRFEHRIVVDNGTQRDAILVR